MVGYNLNYFIGSDEAKNTASKIVDCIKHPEKYISRRITLPNRVLIRGIQGMGRRTLVKCIAGDAGAECKFISALDIYAEGYIDRLKKIIDYANDHIPYVLCIEGLEEIVANERICDPNLSYKIIECQRLIKDSLDEKVCLIAVADARSDLDERVNNLFRTDIIVNYPNTEQKKAFIRKITEDKEYLEMTEYDVDRLCLMTNLFYPYQLATFFQIKNIIDLALGSIIQKKDTDITITGRELRSEIENLMPGTNHKTEIKTAYHEAGHAVLQYKLLGASGFLTMIGNDVLGFGGFSENVGMPYFTKKGLEVDIMIKMAGRAAEIMLCKANGQDEEDAINAGASMGESSDLQRATSLAYKCFRELAYDENITAIPASLPIPDSIQEEIWSNVRKCLHKCWDTTLNFVSRYWVEITALANNLLYMGELSAEEVKGTIDRKAPWISDEKRFKQRLRFIGRNEVPINNELVFGDGTKMKKILERLETFDEFLANWHIQTQYNGESDEEIHSQIISQIKQLPLKKRFDNLFAYLAKDDAGASNLSLDQKMDLIANDLFVAIATGQYDEELKKPVALNLNLGFLDIGEASMTVVPEDANLSDYTLAQKLELYFYRERIKWDPNEQDVFVRFWEIMSQKALIDNGCPIFPPTKEFIYGEDRDEIPENETVIYSVKTGNGKGNRLYYSFNEAMQAVFTNMLNGVNAVCNCFENNDDAIRFVTTTELVMIRDGESKRQYQETDGLNKMELHKRQKREEGELNKWYYMILQLGNDVAENVRADDILEYLNSFSKNFDSDEVNFYILFQLVGVEASNGLGNEMLNYYNKSLI